MDKILLLLALIVFYLSACSPAQPAGSDNQPTNPSPLQPNPASPTVDSSSPGSSNPQAPPILTYTISGGFAGISDTWTIYSDGRILNSEGKTLKQAAQEIDNLINDLEAAGFFSLEKEYIPKDTCCDRFWYELTIQKDGQSYSITTVDDTPNAPDELWASLAIVKEFIAAID